MVPKLGMRKQKVKPWSQTRANKKSWSNSDLEPSSNHGPANVQHRVVSPTISQQARQCLTNV